MTPRHYLEQTLWIAGIAMIVSHGSMRAWSESSRAAAVESMGLPPVSVDESLWSPQRVAAFKAVPASADTPTAVLRVPALGLEVPVYEGTGELNLDRGAGRIERTAPIGAGGNVGIAAHRDGFFRKLKNVRIGQLLYLDTRTQRYRYRIVDTQIVEPTRVSVLAPTPQPSVTLVTCYPFYFVGAAPRRFIVRAEADAHPDARERPAVPLSSEANL